jgi:hypothetical protein
VASNPYILDDSFLFDRPHLALSAIMRGEVGDAVSAVYNPASLAPEERKKVAQQWGLEGPLASLVNITLNPMVLLGAAISARYGIPKLGKMIPQVAKQGESIVRNWGPLSWLMPPSELFAGNNNVWPIFQEGLKKTRDFVTGKAQLVAEVMGGKVLSSAEDIRLGAMLDGLTDASSETTKRLRAVALEAPENLGLTAPQGSRLAALLDRGITTADPKLAGYADGLRKVYDQTWDEVLAVPKYRERIIDVLQRAHPDIEFDPENLAKIKNYLPHIAKLSDVQKAEQSSKFIRELADSIAGGVTPPKGNPLDTADLMSAGTAARKQATRSAIQRRGLMIPDPAELAELGVSEELIGLLQTAKDKGIKAYTLRTSKATSSYLESVGKTYGWTVPHGTNDDGYGVLALREARKILDDPKVSNGKTLYRKFVETYLPLGMGRMTPNQIQTALVWDQTREFFASKLAPTATLGGFLEKQMPGVRKRLSDFLQEDRLASYPGAGAAISGLFFLNTLGGNISAATLNTMSNLSTIGAAGIGNWGSAVRETLEGLARVAARAPKDGWDKALRGEFIEFFAEHQELTPLTRAFTEETQRTFSKILPSGLQAASDKVKGVLLAPFAGTEVFNRLVAFKAFQKKAMTDLKGELFYFPELGKRVLLGEDNKVLLKAASNRAAAHGVGMTQYGSGFEARPNFLADTWSPLSQYTTYPLRTAGLVAQTAATNPGVFGRLLLGAGLTVAGGEELLGTDLRRGVIFGGMPAPSEDGPFAPLPVVPPLLGGIGSLGLAAASGDSKPIREFLPSMIPAGTSLARGVGFLPGGSGLAAGVGRSYADYQNRTPDGRIPVYNAEGSLTGYYSTAQLYARALGFRNPSAQQESILTKWMLSQRENVRSMKQDYMQALYDGDAQHAMTIAERYDEAYPGMGGIPVKKSDIRSLHLRRDVTRLERLMDTMPPELRGQLMPVIGAALGPNADSLMGLQQGGLFQPSIQEREPYRLLPGTRTDQRVSQGLHGVGLQEKLKRAGAGPATTGAADNSTAMYGGYSGYRAF